MARIASKSGSAEQLMANVNRGGIFNLAKTALANFRPSGYTSQGSAFSDTGATESASAPSLSSGAGTSISMNGSDALAKIASLYSAQKGIRKSSAPVLPSNAWNIGDTAGVVSAGLKAIKPLLSAGAATGAEAGAAAGASNLTGAIPVIGYILAAASLAEKAKKRLEPEQMRNTSGMSAGEMVEREATAPGVNALFDPGISALVGKVAGDNPYTKAMGELRNAEYQMVAQPVNNVVGGVVGGDAERAIEGMGHIAAPGTQYLSKSVQKYDPMLQAHDLHADLVKDVLPDQSGIVQYGVGDALVSMNPAAAAMTALDISPPGPSDNQTVNTGLATMTGGISSTIGSLSSAIGNLFGGGDEQAVPMDTSVANNLHEYNMWVKNKPGSVSVPQGRDPVTGETIWMNPNPQYNMAAFNKAVQEAEASKTIPSSVAVNPITGTSMSNDQWNAQSQADKDKWVSDIMAYIKQIDSLKNAQLAAQS